MQTQYYLIFAAFLCISSTVALLLVIYLRLHTDKNISIPPRPAFVYGNNKLILDWNTPVHAIQPEFAQPQPEDLDFIVTPPLPRGLHLDPKNGTIQGRPQEVWSTARFLQIRAAIPDLSWDETVSLEIVVQDRPPRFSTELPFNRLSLIAGEPPAQYLTIPNLLDDVFECSYSIQPSLPSPLHLHPDTGIISLEGVAMAYPPSVHILTCSNSAGESAESLKVSIAKRWEEVLTTTTTAFATRTNFDLPFGEECSTPVSIPETARTVTFDPPLPDGFLFQFSDCCLISTGTTAPQETTTHTVRVNGHACAAIPPVNITIREQAPTWCYENTNRRRCGIGERFVAHAVLSGAHSASFEARNLPPGLQIEANTGRIHGRLDLPVRPSGGDLVLECWARNQMGEYRVLLTLHVVDNRNFHLFLTPEQQKDLPGLYKAFQAAEITGLRSQVKFEKAFRSSTVAVPAFVGSTRDIETIARWREVVLAETGMELPIRATFRRVEGLDLPALVTVKAAVVGTGEPVQLLPASRKSSGGVPTRFWFSNVAAPADWEVDSATGEIRGPVHRADLGRLFVLRFANEAGSGEHRFRLVKVSE